MTKRAGYRVPRLACHRTHGDWTQSVTTKGCNLLFRHTHSDFPRKRKFKAIIVAATLSTWFTALSKAIIFSPKTNNPPGSYWKEFYSASPINHFQRRLPNETCVGGEITVGESASLVDDSNVPCWGGKREEGRGQPSLTEVQFCHKLLLKIMTGPSSSSSCEHCSSLAYLCSLGVFLLLKIRMAEHEMFLFLAAKEVCLQL